MPEVVSRSAHWWQLYNLVTLLNEFTPWFFLPLPLWLLTLLIARRRSALLATALPWAMFLVLYGELFVPRPAHVADACRPRHRRARRGCG